jgi:hypothetical protein
VTRPAADMRPVEESDNQSVPVSIRLGTVVPPEDPEDWRRPLTWVAAAGMLAGPLVALVWFLVAPPASAGEPSPATWLVAGALVAGAALTGATQMGPIWAFAGTLGAGLFGAVRTILVAAVVSPGRAVGLGGSPTVGHAFVAGIAGVAGALAASTLIPALSRIPSRFRRIAVPAAIGIAVSAIVVQLLFSP